MSGFISKIYSYIKDVFNLVCRPRKMFREDEFRFRISTTFKITLIPLIAFVVFYLSLLLVLKIYLIFFEAHGYVGFVALKEAYYDFILSALVDLLPYFGLFLIFMTFTGLYISELLLRPFKLIGTYCEKVVNGEDAIYDPGFFTELKLLASFSEYFFNQMENARVHGKLLPMSIMNRYTGIHKPVFERYFFLQYSFFLLITSIWVGIALYRVIIDTYAHIIQLSIDTLKQGTTIQYFFDKQTAVFDSILWFVLIFHILLYTVLAFHLYSKIAPPAFGIFATMRSFLKGNLKSRVHLVGHYFVRPECRKLNKYLDDCENIVLGNNQ